MSLITGSQVSLETTWSAAHERRPLKLSDEARAQMARSREYIENRLKGGETIYGVNTGFGALSSVKISEKELEQLQKNLIRSHSVGIGEPFSRAETRAIMYLRTNTLARGHSGVRPEVADKILEFLNNDVLPWIPQQGSVGASGDLAPLSHLALALIGEGDVWSPTGQKIPADRMLREKRIEPLRLQAKEGLSLINGCQVMTAVGLLSAYEIRRLLWIQDLAGAMSLEALQGSRKAFDPLIPAARPHVGEAETCRNLLRILGAESEISKSHENCQRVQDAYSLRCMPAVHGAGKAAWRAARSVLEIEANSSTDNPLVFAEDDKVLSCGNFHGEPIAFQMDYLAIAVSALANISECRIAKIMNPAMSLLPAFLAQEGGLNSGLMIVHVAAASLVSENKVLAHPASVDSIPTSADKEDHVSMGTIAARKLQGIVRNWENVLAMELLSACQALDLLKPLQPAAGVQAAFDLIRQHVPFAKEDRIFSRDLDSLRTLIREDKITETLSKSVGDLEV